MALLKAVFTGELFYSALAAFGLFVAVAAATAWAVCSRRHWFLRTVVVGAALSPALLIPGYDMVLIFFIQAAIAAFCWTCMKLWRLRAVGWSMPEDDTRPSPQLAWYQFTLADLLLATVVISAVLAVAVQVPKNVWAEWKWIGFFGLGFAVFSLGFPDIVFLLTGKERLGSMPAGKYHKKKRTKTRVILATVALLLSLCLGVFQLSPAVAVFHFAIHPRPLPPITLPDPNGYDDLIRAGWQLFNMEIVDAEKASIAELRKTVAASDQAMVIARRGLARDCQAPLTYTQADTTYGGSGLIRQLARALLAEGKLAELEGRTSDAVKSYLDIVRLAEAASSGGIAVDFLVAWAWVNTSADALASMHETMKEKPYHKVIEALTAFDAHREPIEDIIARQVLWEEHAYGKLGRVGKIIAPSFDYGTRDALEKAAKQSQAKIRLSLCELALRQYRLKHGLEPKKLADLVPDYLPAVPTDPFSGRPLIYRPTASGYQLYSVGPDRVDDGGKPMQRKSTTDIWPGDLHLREPAN